MANLSVIETVALHELISLQLTEIKKVKYSISKVEDEEFQNYLKDFMNSKKGNIESLKTFLESQQQDQ